MADIKRTNYQTGQFLTAPDFQREQGYHVNLRHAHNLGLHTGGIASGLVTTATDNMHVTVSAGLAIDPAGRDLVLLQDTVVDLSKLVQVGTLQPNTEFWFTIGYADVLDPADKIQIGGVDAYVATTERPAFALAPMATNTPPARVVLLCVVLWSGTAFSPVGQDFCSWAGPVLPPTVNMQNVNITSWLRAPGQAQLGGVGAQSLSVSGDSIIYGNLVARGGSLQFDQPTHSFTNQGNTFGHAAIENAQDFNALVITGRTINEAGQPFGLKRQIQMYDLVTISGNLTVSASANPSVGAGNIMVNNSVYTSQLFVQGRAIMAGKGGYVMDRFVNNLDETLEVGDVVVIGSAPIPPSGYYSEGGAIPVPEVDLAKSAYDTRVCGIVCEVHGESSTDGDTPKMRDYSDEERAAMDLTKVAPGQVGHMVTLGAYAWCKVDADIAPIAPGDLLTTSPTKGHAQKVLDRREAIGAIIGKALSGLEQGQGKIPVIVTLQ